jgi:hypothetical protein
VLPAGGCTVKLPLAADRRRAVNVPEGGMTLHRLRKAVAAGLASTGMAALLMFGLGSATAQADVLDDLAKEFTTAHGGGELSDLLNKSLQLRAMGYRPSKSAYDAITNALNYRPNQVPLIHALQASVAVQLKQKQQADTLAGNNQQPFTVGVNQYDPYNQGGVNAGPNGIGVGGGPVRIGGGQLLGPPPGG